MRSCEVQVYTRSVSAHLEMPSETRYRRTVTTATKERGELVRKASLLRPSPAAQETDHSARGGKCQYATEERGGWRAPAPWGALDFDMVGSTMMVKLRPAASRGASSDAW